MTAPEHRTHTITDELAHLRETPHLGLPREQVLGMAMAARALANGMRAARERRGRAGWSDAEHAARLELAADAHSLDRLTPAQAEQWNQRVAAGDITTHHHGPSGMTISFADLDDHTQIVQATLDNRTVTVAAGSADMGARVRSWLAESPSHDSLNELRDVARDIADDKARVHLDNSRAEAATAAADEHTETRGRDDAEAQERRELADRLGDRVPDRVTGHPSWARAEKQFADLVAAGADPDTLTDAVAGLRFTQQVRSPAGLAMWQMRKTAAGQPGPSDEDTARREAATEWLTTEARDTPADRARATRLIGQFDDAFDAQLADKYPGLLSVDDAHIADHIARADTNTDAAAEHDETARVDEQALATIAAPAVDDTLDRGTERADIALEHGQSVDHEHTAADERDLAENAESDRTRHAADHLTDERAAERAAAAPSRTADGNAVRTANPRPRRGGPTRAPQQNTNRRARTR
ncbi:MULTISPECIES: hypothetical protein [Gordonia]|uniref:hypothetical protein n=1 Tax=Gordonia TaxID=2053 RepID=UPI0007EAAC71|nr:MULTISPECIES: hypothetical protein [Gordonia]OBC06980.1 hypothetical protein A5785_08980 [Gordonia sp. 852002-50395_SCH5434458]OBC17870.1 hypothetical protein A5786_17940 [Gordonia sp. 852002-50816_SCH5313054-a]OBC18268.1 hypothetical protein A5788_10705 [Gordonia sp. 852002-50816_SCH5313054-c]SKX70027.1 Uncharacterised protein [Mycobacteroides abscessus subsp. abscessus]